MKLIQFFSGSLAGILSGLTGTAIASSGQLPKQSPSGYKTVAIEPLQFGGSPRRAKLRIAVLLVASLFLAATADQLLASRLGFTRLPAGFLGIYRRVGPESGAQVFCAGSSLTVSALAWSEVSEALGEGIETWGIGGSSPDVWEEWQRHRPLSNITIVGVSAYDLNETHLADARADVVSFPLTVNDLWVSHADGALSHRILTQYGLKYVRVLFPTAGDADKVLVASRAKLAAYLGRQTSLAEHEGVIAQPPPPILDAGETTTGVSEWTRPHLLRRLAVLRAENRGRHEFFQGPKNQALHRLLRQARQQGQVIVVVLPVSSAYSQEFLDDQTDTAFERAISDAMAVVPGATLVRADRLTGITDPRYFFDLVHLNSAGRRLVTDAFLKQIAPIGPQPDVAATARQSIDPLH